MTRLPPSLGCGLLEGRDHVCVTSVSHCLEQQLVVGRCLINIPLSTCPCVYSTPLPLNTHSGIRTRQNQTREVGGSLGDSELDVWVQGSEAPKPDHPHMPHWPLERDGASLLSPDPGQKPQLGMKLRPSKAATRGRQHPPCELDERLAECPPQLGHLRPLRSEGETPELCAMPCPQSAEFLSTPQRPGR